jgi:hypothetical protein
VDKGTSSLCCYDEGQDRRRNRCFSRIYPLNAAHGDVGDRKTNVPELRAPDMTLRARTYRFRAFSQFTEARKVHHYPKASISIRLKA